MKLDRRKVFLLIAYVIVVVTVSTLLEKVVFSKIVIAVGKSVPYLIFLKDSNFGNLTKGSYVVVKTSEEDSVAKGELIIKQISCIPGEKIVISGLNYYCCGVKGSACEMVGIAKTKRLTGEEVIPFNPCKKKFCEVVIPEGFYFVIGFHKDSYDSRYFGLVEAERILLKLKPII